MTTTSSTKCSSCDCKWDEPHLMTCDVLYHIWKQRLNEAKTSLNEAKDILTKMDEVRQ